ncbi:MAG: sulfonate transport system substrate-binding protein [Frankiaceae bacterium]|jgi:sulfonate transport system substrate-binding protein|nr:sulfonate transport system substrate-binding protein [Frankiaceae bacterium]
MISTAIRHRRLVAGALTATVLTALAGCAGTKPVAATGTSAGGGAAGVTVRIGVLNGSDNGLALAKADGSLEAAVKQTGASVSFAGPFPAFAPAAEAVKAGAVDITVGGLLSWVGGVAANKDLVVFADNPDQGVNSGIVATAKSGITTVADLKGKKVAVNKAGTGEYLLLKALAKAGIDPKDVTRVYLPVTDGATAFQSGQVDAWATWGNFFATAATTPGAKVLATAADVDSHNDTVYVVTRAFLTAHPDVVKAVAGALKAEYDKVSKDKSVLAAGYKASGLPQSTIDFLLNVPATPLEPITAEKQAAFQKEADFWTDNKVIPSKVDVAASTATGIGG